MKDLIRAIIGLLLAILPIGIIIKMGVDGHWAVHQYVAVFIGLTIVEAFAIPFVLGLAMFVVTELFEKKNG